MPALLVQGSLHEQMNRGRLFAQIRPPHYMWLSIHVLGFCGYQSLFVPSVIYLWHVLISREEAARNG